MRYTNCNTAGFSIIEMLVGIVIGLIIVATGTVMYSDMLKSQKEITSSARLNQELGAAMAVVSNEIRRAGFRICDINDATFECPEIIDTDDAPREGPFISYSYGQDVVVSDHGRCIEYRYNANLNEADSDASELRGFRIIPDGNGIGVVQMSGSAGDVACDSDDNWVDLTNPKIINLDLIASGFSTSGSKCLIVRKDSDPDAEDLRWHLEVQGNETGLACDNETTVTCTAIAGDNPCGTPARVTDDRLFISHQVLIKMKAELTSDSGVAKDLSTSVKVANPWIGRFP